MRGIGKAGARVWRGPPFDRIGPGTASGNPPVPAMGITFSEGSYLEPSTPEGSMEMVEGGVLDGGGGESLTPLPGSLPWPSHSQAQRQKSRVWELRVGWWVVRQPPPLGWVGGCPNPLYFNVFQQTQSQSQVDNKTTVYINHFEKEMLVAKVDLSPSLTGMLKKRDG